MHELSRDDHTDEAPAVGAVSTIRMKAIGLAARAAGNVFDLDARKLGANGRAQIDECFFAFASNDEAETIGDVASDFEAARSDARTDRRDDRRRREAFHRDVEDARVDASPSGVDGGDLARVGGGEENRNAVGDADCDRVTLADAGDAVGFDLEEIDGILVRRNYGPTVDLFRLEEAATVEADVPRERVQVTRRARRERVGKSVVREQRRAEQQRGRA
jgi:hypothetical protein